MQSDFFSVWMQPLALLSALESLSSRDQAAAFGLATAICTFAWVWVGLRDCGLAIRRTPFLYALLGGLLGGMFAWLMLEHDIQSTPEVRPEAWGKFLRIPYHILLLVGLLSATATDFREFYISSRVMTVGTVLGLLLAVLSGDLQMCHVWVDWNQEVPQIQGPYLPAWLALHPHWHGLAWSLAGAACGALMALVVQLLGSFVLAKPALGSGDIHLMAMIGTTLGWQPTVVAFLFAPLIALTLGAVAKIVFNRPALPYGPFLAAGAIAVMFNWRRIWMLEIPLGLVAGPDDRQNVFAVRRLFGDAIALLTVAGIAIGGFIILLGLLRLYHTIPVRPGNSDEREPGERPM